MKAFEYRAPANIGNNGETFAIFINIFNDHLYEELVDNYPLQYDVWQAFIKFYENGDIDKDYLEYENVFDNIVLFLRKIDRLHLSKEQQDLITLWKKDYCSELIKYIKLAEIEANIVKNLVEQGVKRENFTFELNKEIATKKIPALDKEKMEITYDDALLLAQMSSKEGREIAIRTKKAIKEEENKKTLEKLKAKQGETLAKRRKINIEDNLLVLHDVITQEESFILGHEAIQTYIAIFAIKKSSEIDALSIEDQYEIISPEDLIAIKNMIFSFRSCGLFTALANVPYENIFDLKADYENNNHQYFLDHVLFNCAASNGFLEAIYDNVDHSKIDIEEVIKNLLIVDRIDLFKRFLNYKIIKPDYIDKEGNNLLLLAVKNNAINIFICLVREYKNLNINHQNLAGDSLTHEAAKRDSNLFIKELVKLGANINLKNKEGQSPLITGVQRNVSIGFELLLNGANYRDYISSADITEIHYDTMRNFITDLSDNFEISKYRLLHLYTKYAVLSNAMFYNNNHVIKQIVAEEDIYNIKNYDDADIFYIAFNDSNKQLVSYLMQREDYWQYMPLTYIDEVDIYGYSALAYATKKQDINTIKNFLDKGASPIVGSDDKKPMDIILRINEPNHEIIKMFIVTGYDYREQIARTNNGTFRSYLVSPIKYLTENTQDLPSEIYAKIMINFFNTAKTVNEREIRFLKRHIEDNNLTHYQELLDKIEPFMVNDSWRDRGNFQANIQDSMALL